MFIILDSYSKLYDISWKEQDSRYQGIKPDIRKVFKNFYLSHFETPHFNNREGERSLAVNLNS